MRGLFVTGTDTGVGKTILSAVLLAAMAAAGEPVRAYKPVVTGLDASEEDDSANAWPPDHELLAAASGTAADDVSPLRFGPAVSPQLAAELVGEHIDLERLLAPIADAVAADGEPKSAVVVEGVGGLLTPLGEDLTVRDFAGALGLPMLIAARPGLGTINHTLLTLHAARAAGLDVRAVVLTPWPEQTSRLERSNREMIARLGVVEVEILGRVQTPDVAALALAGATMPWRRWLGKDGVA